MSSLLDSSPSPQSSDHQPPSSYSTTQNGVANNQTNEMINSSSGAATNETASDANRTDTINNSTSATAKNFVTTNTTDNADELNSDTNENGTKKDDSMFECNICLDTAKEAVVSMCGHLFCWPCLHQWLETRPTRQLCPVCKAAISKEKVIPLYGRGSSKEEDPRTKVPPRPAGQRTEPEPNTTFQGFGFGDGGFQMSLGIGAFPFGIFTSTFNFGTNLRSQNPSTTVQFEEDQFLSRAFLWVTVIFLAWLVWA